MKEDKYTTINNLKPYFYTLININNKLIKLTCFKGYDNFQKSDLFLEICDLIFKIIPTKTLKDNIITIDENSGILLIDETKRIILPELKEMAEKYNAILVNMKKLRNKLEHEPHNIVKNFILSGQDIFRGFCFIKFQYKDKEISVSTGNLISIINYLNKSFTEIQKYLNRYSNDNILKGDHYYHELINEKFSEIITNNSY